MTTTTTPARKCEWEIQVPSGCEEPTSESDMWKIVECDGWLVVDTADGWECENGHRYDAYGSSQQIAAERAEALAEALGGSIEFFHYSD